MANDNVDLYGTALMNEVATLGFRYVFFCTPYRTGALARGIHDFGSVANGAGFSLLTQQTQYGAVLNELPIIHYKLANRRTGKVYEGKYANKHYKWIDNAAANLANEIPVYFPNVKRII